MFRYCRLSYKSVNYHQNSIRCLKERIRTTPSSCTSHVKVKYKGPSVHRCNFHTSRPLGIPPIIIGLKLKFLKVGAALMGRHMRGRFAVLKRKQKIFILGSIFVVIISASLTYYYSHLTVTPVTKRKRFLAHTPSQLQQLVDAEAEMVLQNYRSNDEVLPADHPYYRRITEIITRLVECNSDIEEMKSHQWTVFIVKDTDPNAAVLPNGYVFVNDGLIEFAHNDDQLAFILGHEMAHALLSHSAESLSRVQLSEYLLISFMAFFWTFLGDGVAFITAWYFDKCAKYMIHLPFSRAQETEADVVGLKMTAKACYDIREGTVIWKMMKRMDDFSGALVFEFLSTHPLSDKRAEDINYLMPKYLDLRADCKCPPLPKIDPRDKLVQMKEECDNYLAAMKSRQNLKQMTKVKV